MTEFSSVLFVIQFDCLDDEIINLNHVDALEAAQGVLDSTPIGERIQVRPEEENEEYWIEGDASLHDSEDFAAALKGEVRYGVMNIGFEGHLDGKEIVSWSELRQALVHLRSQNFEASMRWSSFDIAPVSLSLGYLKPLDSGKFVKFSVSDGISYLDNLESAAIGREDIASFLSYFKAEIAIYRAGMSSRFLNAWFSTELLLTQSVFAYEDDEASPVFLKPVLTTEQFEWLSGPTPAGPLLESDRYLRSGSVFWVNPLPANPFHDGSDWHYIYQDAVDESKRKGATGTEFNQIGFVLTMWNLHNFLDEYDQDDTQIRVEEFMQEYESDLEPLFVVMNESKYSFDDPLLIPSEKHSFLQHLPLPGNAEDIWDNYLTLLGLDQIEK